MDHNKSIVDIAERYAKDFFGLTLPIRAADLKSAFKAAAKKFHTDTSGSDCTKEQFIKMKDAYDFLVKLEGMKFVYYNETQIDGSNLVTTDGIPLSQLGLGLGPMKNGRDCEHCKHQGYIEFRTAITKRLSYVRCHQCSGTGEIELFSPLLPKGRLR